MMGDFRCFALSLMKQCNGCILCGSHWDIDESDTSRKSRRDGIVESLQNAM